tara:strand:+ start:548 stop:667 length:120 start_codon:yes stop_codon:yes gene_type:complete
MVDKLSKQDVTKHNDVYKLNYIEALNILGYWRTLDNMKK